MDGRRNFSSDPDAEPRWYPEDRGYDDRAHDDRARDDRARDDRARDDWGRDEPRDERGYTPTRYADERDYDDAYRVPEPRAARIYDDSGELPVDSVPRARRSEAIDRSALQRPVAAAPPVTPLAPPVTAPGGGFSSPPVTPPGGAFNPSPAAPGGGFGQQPSAAPGGGFAQQPASVSGGGFGQPVSGAGNGFGASPAADVFGAPTTLTAAVPPPAAVSEGPGAVYRSKRPGLAVALIVLTVLFELPVLRLFFTASTADRIAANGTLSSMFMIIGLPMFSLGVYGLIGGAAASAPGVRAWLRPPLAYLPLAVLLFLAAAIST